jgi:hypothetical protein
VIPIVGGGTLTVCIFVTSPIKSLNICCKATVSPLTEVSLFFSSSIFNEGTPLMTIKEREENGKFNGSIQINVSCSGTAETKLNCNDPTSQQSQIVTIYEQRSKSEREQHIAMLTERKRW